MSWCGVEEIVQPRVVFSCWKQREMESVDVQILQEPREVQVKDGTDQEQDPSSDYSRSIKTELCLPRVYSKQRLWQEVERSTLVESPEVSASSGWDTKLESVKELAVSRAEIRNYTITPRLEKEEHKLLQLRVAQLRRIKVREDSMPVIFVNGRRITQFRLLQLKPKNSDNYHKLTRPWTLWKAWRRLWRDPSSRPWWRRRAPGSSSRRARRRRSGLVPPGAQVAGSPGRQSNGTCGSVIWRTHRGLGCRSSRGGP